MASTSEQVENTEGEHVGGTTIIYADDLIPESDSDDNTSERTTADSATGGLNYASSTSSANSEIHPHEVYGGRTYHGYKAGKYQLPNDERERDRLDLQHKSFLLTLDDKLFLAPVEPNPKHVLDFAAGTGIWALDFARTHPTASVLGTDLSPIHPDRIPPNCTFEIHDAEDEWAFPDPFDFIHARAILSCFTDPRSVIQKAYDSLAPGGYLELQDGFYPFQFKVQPPPDTPLLLWNKYISKGASKTGRNWDNAKNYARWMSEIGFEDVVEKRFYWPSNAWAKGEKAKELSVYFNENLKKGLEGVSMKVFTQGLGWSVERTRGLLEEVRRDLDDPKLWMYATVIFVYGRKPANH